MSDINVENVCNSLREREKRGMSKYGVNTMRKDLSTLEWLQHLQEELMDACVYVEKLKNEMKEIQAEMSGMKWKREDSIHRALDNIQYHGKAKNYKQ